MSINTAAWMANTPLPDILRPPFAVVGGTSLLADFFARVSSSRDSGEMWICSPYIDRGISDVVSAMPNILHREISLCVLTSNRENAANAFSSLRRFPWASLVMAVKETLHAKIYLYCSSRPERICLVGSHNLTKAGTARNFEAGVLFGSVGADTISTMVLQVRDSLQIEMRDSKILDARSLGIE